MIVHITTRADWEYARKVGEYRAASLYGEGFIHASTPEQALDTANRYYFAEPDLLLLWIDPQRLEAELRWEASHGETYPHIYGPLNLAAVSGVSVFSPDPDGGFRRLPHPQQQPELATPRLLLRPFRQEDAPAVQRLAGDEAIAATTLNIPHPYPPGLAERWIATHLPGFQLGEQATFAITRLDSGEVLGAIGLIVSRLHQRAEMGYWMGKPFWNQGYTTEAARRLLRYGFEELSLNRICARHFARNPASGRVMEKIGMRFEGELRSHDRHWSGSYEDVRFYGILRREWEALPPDGR